MNYFELHPLTLILHWLIMKNDYNEGMNDAILMVWQTKDLSGCSLTRPNLTLMY